MFREIRSVHFIGICGTAMASVAVALKEKGYQVRGSDQNVYPPMSTYLMRHGIPVVEGYAERNLQPHPDLVVIGNAVSRGNPEVEYVLEKKLFYCSLPELLKEFFLRGKRCIVITGTHGKTTVTSLMAWVFEHAGLNPSFLIGGIPLNFECGARFTESEWVILEGDEYDTAFFDKRSKFLHYCPEIAVINNIEFDHADIFENLEAVKKAFIQLIRIIPRNGALFVNGDDPNIASILHAAHCPVKRFGFGEGNALRAFNTAYAPTVSEFEIPSFKFKIGLLGEFNIRNALAVIAVAKYCGLKNHQIQEAFDTFKGVRRRLEVRGIAGGVIVLDDFGHHPTAIHQTLQALRQRYPREKIWAIFEPRSNTTRRNVFQQALVDAFGPANGVIIAAVARAELLSDSERLNPEKLASDLQSRGKEAVYIPKTDEIINFVYRKVQPGEVVIIFSNGGFENIHARLLERLAHR